MVRCVGAWLLQVNPLQLLMHLVTKIVAMNSEHQALMRNKTRRLVPRPKGKNIIGCKWVYKIKENMMALLIDIKRGWLQKDLYKDM